MIKRSVFIGLFLLMLVAPCALGEAQAVTSTQLIEEASALDGQPVTFTGEVVGDIMRRGDYTWLNLSDTVNAMGVWIPTALVGDIHTAGRYAAHGDEVRIQGVFHRACKEHGGDMDIHATQITLLSPAYATPHTVQPVRLVIAALLTLVAGTLLTRFLLKRRAMG